MHYHWIIFVTAVLCTVHTAQCTTPYKRLKEALKTVDKIICELSALKETSSTCDSQLSTVKDDLTAACNRNTTGTEISLLKSKQTPGQTPVLVDVSSGHKTCVESIRDHCSQLNAEIWCLRLGLWRNNHEDERISLAQDELFGHILKREQNREPPAPPPQRRKRDTEAVKGIAPDDITKPPTGYRIRKEYRTLTLTERQKYHSAVKKLYDQKTFAAFARVHKLGIKMKGVHRGEAFLPWHRAFLALYEEALRQIDPDVSLPYWDSRMDYNMVTPTLSVMWDVEHLGTGFGLVTDGPFANFSTDENPLKRSIGQGSGSLMKPQKVEAMFEEGFCRMGDIYKRLESSHNGVHRWVGSTMARGWSASDPVFYMHHAYIDKIWEDFRKRQNSSACNFIDPGNDYPFFNENSPRPTKPEHMADEDMDGMDFLKNKDGIKNYWTQNWYGYADSPVCSNNCDNSPDLTCQDGACVCVMSEDPGEDIDTSGGRRKRAAPAAYPNTQLYASYKDTSAYSGDNSSICRTQPYSTLCPTPKTPRTVDEIASAMVNNQLPMPDKIKKIFQKLKRNEERIFEYPPESEPIFFREKGDLENDCRTADTATFDLIKAMLEGRTIVGRKSK